MIKNTKLKTIDTLQSNLLEHFNTYIKDLKNDLDNSLKLIKEDQVKKLSDELNNPLKELISNEIKTLKSLMNRIDIENS